MGEREKVKEMHFAEITHLENKILDIKEEMTKQIEIKEKEHLESLSAYEETHATRRTNLVKGHAIEVLQLKKDLKCLTLEKQEAYKKLEQMKSSSDCIVKAKVDAIAKERNALQS